MNYLRRKLAIRQVHTYIYYFYFSPCLFYLDTYLLKNRKQISFKGVSRIHRDCMSCLYQIIYHLIALGSVEERAVCSSGSTLVEIYLPLSEQRKFSKNRIHSSSPANIVNSPWNGFCRKNRSNTALSVTLPDFQQAQAIVIWYKSVHNQNMIHNFSGLKRY